MQVLQVQYVDLSSSVVEGGAASMKVLQVTVPGLIIICSGGGSRKHAGVTCNSTWAYHHLWWRGEPPACYR